MTSLPFQGSSLRRRKSLISTTGLSRGTGLRRSASFAAGAGLNRRGLIRPVSGKRRAENSVRALMIASEFPERSLCVVCTLSQHHPGVIPADVIARCGQWADDVHEPLTRARGGSITDPGNAVPLCRSCHDAIGLEPGWAYSSGLLRHSWDGPPGGGR